MRKEKLTVVCLGMIILAVSLFGAGMRTQTVKNEVPRELHIGVTVEENTYFPEGETMSDNQLLDLIREELGIRIEYDWVYSPEEFNRNIDMHIACDALPDALMVNEQQYLQMLEYGQLQPVTELYEQKVSEQVKAFVKSGGDEMLEAVKRNGEMMAIPFPNLIASNVNVMWIRQDWLDQLGLEAPKTIEEVINVSRQFVEKQMGGDGTIGILGPGMR